MVTTRRTCTGRSLPEIPRRLISWSALTLAFAVVWTLLPLWLVVALGSDLVRQSRFAWTRLIVFGAVFLLVESVGLAIALVLRAVGLVFPAGDLARHRRLQATYLGLLWTTALSVWDLTVTVEDRTGGLSGPALLLVRHTSFADTVLAAQYVAKPHDIALRYVLKHELLWAPCLDLVGQRLPNAFVRRDGAESAQDAQRVRALTTDLGPREGVLIYPEGTRFTTARKMLAVQRLMSKDPVLGARAARLVNVLPPRPGGVLSLLDGIAGDVVVLMHVGFEDAADLRAMANGALIGREIRLRIDRFDAASRPTADGDRLEWVWSLWEEMDRWVGAFRPAPR